MSGADLYRQMKRESVPQGAELPALFDAITTAALEARRAIGEGRMEDAHTRLTACQMALVGLRLGLLPEPEDLHQNLSALYSHCEGLLAEANLQKSPEPIDAALAVLTLLRDAWQEAAAASLKSTVG